LSNQRPKSGVARQSVASSSIAKHFRGVQAKPAATIAVRPSTVVKPRKSVLQNEAEK